MLLFLTTGQTDFFRALSALPVPAFFTTALFMTFRYVFTLLKITEDSVLARRSRTITGTAPAEKRHWAASRLAYLLRRSLATAGEVSLAMTSRGFAGKVRTIPAPPPGAGDMAWVGFAAFVFFIFLFVG
jgi:energy-coupling factor transporter transmembrane protein EcfT